LEIMKEAQTHNTRLVFPVDYQVAYNNIQGPLSYTSNDTLPHNSIGIAAGIESIRIFSDIIEKSSTIFFNGLMGTMERQETLESSEKLFKAIAQSPGYSVIAGGDSISLVEKLHLASQLNYLSTGGGATLAFLSHEVLPGLMVFSE